MAEQLIKIFVNSAVDRYQRTVVADVLGPLAVYQNPTIKTTPNYTLGHIPTGYGIKDGLTKRKALRLRSKLAHLDWNFKKPSSRKVKAMKPVVKAIFKALGY